MKMRGLMQYKKAKKADISSEKTIAIILVVLLIAVIAIIIFRQNFIDWIRNLPSYESPKNELIDMSQLSDTEIKSFCPVRVGFYKMTEGDGIFKQYYIFVRENDKYKQTPFYIAKERKWSGEYSIIRKAQTGADPVAANIVDNKIVLKAEFLDSEIKLINRAWTLKGNLICGSEKK